MRKKETIESVRRFSTPFGEAWLGEQNGALSVLCLGEPPADLPQRETELSEGTVRWLHAYFDGAWTPFPFPLLPQGTPFQQSIWRGLLEIPYGETRSYAWLAQRAGSPKAFRAAGDACRRNPIWIVIPCHRAIASSGALTGYAGGLAMKQALLALERGNG